MPPVARQDVVLVTEDVWLSILNMAPHVAAAPGVPSGGDSLVGVVQITGDWVGAVTVQVPWTLAVRLAAAMFAASDSVPTRDDQVDALGEITNMIGGSLKGIVDGCCHLSLPAVIAGSGYELCMPGGRTVHRVDFECDGEPFVVSVIATEVVHSSSTDGTQEEARDSRVPV